MTTEAALELDATTDDGVSVEVHFPNFPGVWLPGRPIAISELGFTTNEAALTAASGLPLRLVDVEHGSAPLPARDNHAANEEQSRAAELAAATGEAEKPRAKKTAADDPTGGEG